MSKNVQHSTNKCNEIYMRYKGRCAICGNPIDFGSFTVDHKNPLARGGSNEYDNLQATCDSCNHMKHYLTQEEFMKKLWKVVIHNLPGIVKIYLKGGVRL